MAKRFDPKPFFFLGVVAVIAIGGYFILTPPDAGKNYHEFASCLADKNATKYGFDACPHCNKQKAIIGREAFRKNFSSRGYYVKCRPESEASERLGETANRISSVEPVDPSTTQGQACEINVGEGTPTWVIDGQKYVGEQSLEELSEATGCPLPEGYQKREDVGGFTPEENNSG